MAGNGGALELPVGTTQAAVPQAEDIAIPLLYDKTVALVQQHIALQDPAALLEEPAAAHGSGPPAATPNPLHTALLALRPPGDTASLPLDGAELRVRDLPRCVQIIHSVLADSGDLTQLLTRPLGAFGGLWVHTATRLGSRADCAELYKAHPLIRTLLGWLRLAETALSQRRAVALKETASDIASPSGKLKIGSLRLRCWGGPIMPALLFGIITQSEHKA